MSDSLVLGFDTSAGHCAAALLRGDELVADCCEEMARGQVERLMPMLEEMLSAAGAAWRDLEALGVGIGPGNFTGIRVAVSAARGLALGLESPAVGVSSLEAMALGSDGPVLCSLDARRGMFYVQRFGDEPSGPALAGPEDLPLPGPGATVIGHRAEELAERSGGVARAPVHGLAEAIARIAVRRMRDPAPERPAPLYLRAPDAAPPREAPPEILQ